MAAWRTEPKNQMSGHPAQVFLAQQLHDTSVAPDPSFSADGGHALNPRRPTSAPPPILAQKVEGLEQRLQCKGAEVLFLIPNTITLSISGEAQHFCESND